MNITLIGAGNMGGAIALGLINHGMSPSLITVCDLDAEKLHRFEKMGAKTSGDVKEGISEADVVILAIKPNGFEGLLPLLTDNKTAIFVSIAAGISISYIKSVLGDVKVIRVMPNTPAMIGEGMTAISVEAPVTEEDYERVKEIFSAVGKVEQVEESFMDVVVSLNGSSPAYVYMFIDAMVKNGVAAGIPYEKALNLAAQSVVGAAKMVMSSNEMPDVLTKRVCSPGGTTIQAVDELNRRGFGDAIDEAMKACTQRSKELTK